MKFLRMHLNTIVIASSTFACFLWESNGMAEPRLIEHQVPAHGVLSNPPAYYRGIPFTYWPAVWNYQAYGWAVDRETPMVVETTVIGGTPTAPGGPMSVKPMPELLSSPGKGHPMSQRAKPSPQLQGVSPYRITPVQN